MSNFCIRIDFLYIFKNEISIISGEGAKKPSSSTINENKFNIFWEDANVLANRTFYACMVDEIHSLLFG
jgi:hypothetical protein